MPDITSIFARTIYNSRGSKTIETDVTVQGGYTGRVCAPSGASVGKYEAVAFPDGGPEKCVQILADNTSKFSGVDAANAERVYKALRAIDSTPDYSIIGGATAFAVSIAAAEAAAKECKVPLFEFLSNGNEYYFPYPLGNILGGGAHAGPGTPDIQEILVCATGAKTVHDAIATNFAVHKELGELLKKSDASFTNGRGDEGGWAPKMDNQAALEISAKACENLGFTLGKEVSLGVDFASSTQWNGSKYAYERAGFENDSGQQVDFVSEIIEKGENLPHSGRFMLATFLLNRGQNVEQIAPLFKNAPDYNERTTMYQLRNLSGVSGGTKYKCPSCEKIKSQDMCFANEKCDGIFTPLHFGRKKIA